MDLVDLEARISALELVVATHVLQAGVGISDFDPKAFAESRRDAWTLIGQSMCAGCSTEAEEERFTRAYAGALERFGNLMVSLADPIQEAIDEVDATMKPQARQQA
ncbi:hypothetical protein [Novosphingobium sp. M1R2S20]|uniref:Uncharacterized protein n=1 Tax=Novosphingobium rhizovicinum TaxID=3228928 RepID=A0ABV3RGG8_9SPHN